MQNHCRFLDALSIYELFDGLMQYIDFGVAASASLERANGMHHSTLLMLSVQVTITVILDALKWKSFRFGRVFSFVFIFYFHSLLQY